MAVLSITSISNNSLYLPTFSAKADTEDSRPNTGKHADLVQLSDHAKNLISSQLPKDQTEEKEEKSGNQSVQISSSIGRLSRVTGLQREEVAALYQSINKLT